MQNELFKILEFGDGTKWFVIGVTNYNNETYKYLIKVNNEETDFIDEFLLVKYYIKDGKEYIVKVKDPKISETVMLKIMPEIKPLLSHKKEILEKLQA